jgi:hypothetical protein
MRVKEILKINEQLNHFNVSLPNNTPKVELKNSPGLEQIFEAFHALNIPYKELSIEDMKEVIKLMKKRYNQDEDCTKILDKLNNHVFEIENWW